MSGVDFCPTGEAKINVSNTQSRLIKEIQMRLPVTFSSRPITNIFHRLRCAADCQSYYKHIVSYLERYISIPVCVIHIIQLHVKSCVTMTGLSSYFQRWQTLPCGIIVHATLLLTQRSFVELLTEPRHVAFFCITIAMSVQPTVMACAILKHNAFI